MYNHGYMRFSKICCGFLSVLFLVVAGCGGSTSRYINPSANFSFIKNVAVLPFNNLGDDRFAGERVRSAFMLDAMSRGIFEVVEQGEVSKVLKTIYAEAGVEEGTIVPVDKDMLKILSEKLGVQAVMVGSVDEYGASYGGTVVGLSVRMLDTSSGMILWQASAEETGTSTMRKFVGLDDVGRTAVTKRVVKKVLDTLR